MVGGGSGEEMIESSAFEKHTFSVDKYGMVRVDPPFTGGESNPLGLAVTKWKFIVEQMENDVRVRNCGGPRTCALCRAFHQSPGDCGECPITASSHTGCRDTPYADFVDDPTLENAKAELEFLKGLRDGQAEN